MNADTERLNIIDRHITERLDYLVRLTYHHEANIAQPDPDKQFDYLIALGEMRTLQAVSRLLMGLASTQNGMTP